MDNERLKVLEDTAHKIATRAHLGQIDKVGKDYIDHPRRVSAKGKNASERIVGLLHDVIEDTEVALQDLREAGFPQEILDAVDCLTKREGETKVDYLTRVKGNELARVVKLYDIEDNADPIRMSGLSEEVRGRLTEKYRFAKHFLEICPPVLLKL